MVKLPKRKRTIELKRKRIKRWYLELEDNKKEEEMIEGGLSLRAGVTLIADERTGVVKGYEREENWVLWGV